VKNGARHWLDAKSERHVWVIDATSVADWPAEPPWTCSSFGLLFAAEHVVDVEQLAELALAQGLAIACAWGPGCSMIEDDFDDVIVGHETDATTDANVVLTTSHADESLGEALDFFLDAALPARAKVARCDAWVVFALGSSNQRRVERALQARGAQTTAAALAPTP
jgi:hypothetical protein